MGFRALLLNLSKQGFHRQGRWQFVESCIHMARVATSIQVNDDSETLAAKPLIEVNEDFETVAAKPLIEAVKIPFKYPSILYEQKWTAPEKNFGLLGHRIQAVKSPVIYPSILYEQKLTALEKNFGLIPEKKEIGHSIQYPQDPCAYMPSKPIPDEEEFKLAIRLKNSCIAASQFVKYSPEDPDPAPWKAPEYTHQRVRLHGFWRAKTELRLKGKVIPYCRITEKKLVGRLYGRLPQSEMEHQWMRHGYWLYWTQEDYFKLMADLFDEVVVGIEAAIEETLQGASSQLVLHGREWKIITARILRDKIREKIGKNVCISCKVDKDGKIFVDQLILSYNSELHPIDSKAEIKISNKPRPQKKVRDEKELQKIRKRRQHKKRKAKAKKKQQELDSTEVFPQQKKQKSTVTLESPKKKRQKKEELQKGSNLEKEDDDPQEEEQEDDDQKYKIGLDDAVHL